MVQPSANINLITFLSNASEDGNSESHNVSFNRGVFRVFGTFDGASVSIYSVTPDGTAIQLSDWAANPITFSSTTETTLENILLNEKMYAALSNAGSSTSLTVTLQRL